MTTSTFEIKAVAGYEAWLQEQIRQLSVTALSSNALTCNACGEVAGTYIIDYQGHTFRLGGEETYSFLSFIVNNASG